MHTHHTVKEEEKGWRSNWFVKNVLAEIPIIGGFFHTAHVPHALHNAGKSAAMLVGGSMGMMLETFKVDDTDNMATRMTKATANMAVGMTLGNIAYNTFVSVGSKAYHGCRYLATQQHSPSSSPLLVEASPDQPIQTEKRLVGLDFSNK